MAVTMAFGVTMRVHYRYNLLCLKERYATFKFITGLFCSLSYYLVSTECFPTLFIVEA